MTKNFLVCSPLKECGNYWELCVSIVLFSEVAPSKKNLKYLKYTRIYYIFNIIASQASEKKPG